MQTSKREAAGGGREGDGVLGGQCVRGALNCNDGSGFLTSNTTRQLCKIIKNTIVLSKICSIIKIAKSSIVSVNLESLYT